MILDIIICVGLVGLIVYLIYSIIKKIKDRKKAKEKDLDFQSLDDLPKQETEKIETENKQGDVNEKEK